MTSKEEKEIRQALKLADDFSGHLPRKIVRIATPRTRVRLEVGVVTGIMYLARRDGEVKEYIHRFAKGVRPSLVVTPDGQRLELIGGSFSFTDRGIVDKKLRSR